MTTRETTQVPTRDATVETLWRRRPRHRFVRVSLLLMLALMIGAWCFGGISVGELLAQTSASSLGSFLERVAPKPVRGGPWDWAAVGHWAGDLMARRGWAAAATTLAISVAAILLAALAGLLLMMPAARTLACPQPYLPSARAPGLVRRASWAVLRTATRGLLIFLRSIPEYVWAFLLFGILGPNAWPAVLALAFHNAGILGKLGAEVVENLPAGPPAALRALGASRTQIAAAGLWPTAMPRFLLYFFYRWETCVREATVLGMLGMVSLGYWIDDARHRLRYDELVFWILVGSAIVLLGDLLSAIARMLVRRAP